MEEEQPFAPVRCKCKNFDFIQYERGKFTCRYCLAVQKNKKRECFIVIKTCICHHPSCEESLCVENCIDKANVFTTMEAAEKYRNEIHEQSDEKHTYGTSILTREMNKIH